MRSPFRIKEPLSQTAHRSISGSQTGNGLPESLLLNNEWKVKR